MGNDNSKPAERPRTEIVPRPAPRPTGYSGGTAVVGVEEGVSVRPNCINLVLVIDASGSMAGSKWRHAVAGVEAAVDALTSSDFVTIVVFSDKLAVIGPAQKASLDMARFRSMSAGGGTHLYDASLAGLMAAVKLHREIDTAVSLVVMTYVVIMTDGEDSGSSQSIGDVQQVLLLVNRLRNFKVTFVGVDLEDSGRRPMHLMASVGDMDITYRDLDSSSFRSFFEHLTVALRRRVIVVG